MSKPAKSTLSSIVSDLVRAAIGGNHQAVPDEDLDKYVADMIMKGASNAHAKYKTVGLDAYTHSNNSTTIDNKNQAQLASGAVIDRADSNGLKTNKRFLSSIIKNTDDHNQALIRAEEKRASEIAKELIADLDRKAADNREGGRPSSSKRDPRRTLSESTGAKSPASKSSARLEGAVLVKGRGERRYEPEEKGSKSVSSSSSSSKLGSRMDKYFQDGYDPLMDTHSDDGTSSKKSKKEKKEKKEKKAKRSKDDRNQSHKRRRSSEKEHSSRGKSRRYDSDSDTDMDTDDSDRGSGRGRSSRSSGAKETSQSSSRSKRKRSKSSSPSNSSRHVESNQGSRRKHSRKGGKRKGYSDSEDNSNDSDDKQSRRHRREHRHSNKRGRSRSRSPSSQCSRSSSRSRSRSPSPPPPSSTAKPAAREWDLHKINKSAIHAHLFGPQRTRT